MSEFTFTLERQALLAHYEGLLHSIEDTQTESRMQHNPERNAEVSALTADALQFRDMHDITITELNSWKKRNVQRASSVAHAVQLLSRSA
ncbi:MAG: hypothetical protein U5L02_06245 [Rheinheimera sp.]|nr:hypothetical protein [Rheinheimera sp.]